MSTPNIREQTADRYISLMREIQGNLQDFLSDYERNDDIEDWESVSACTNALIQVDMSIHGAIEWMEIHAGMKPDPDAGRGHLQWDPPTVTPTGQTDGDEPHGSYL